MAYTGIDLVKHVKKVKSYPTAYLYGANVEILTEEKLDYLRNKFPDYITADKYENAKANFLGRYVTDCKGLLYSYYPKFWTTSAIYASAVKCVPLSKNNTSDIPPGAVLYMPGHIGIYIGDGREIEARGTAYGVVERPVSETSFTHWLLMPEFDYSTRRKSLWPWLLVAGLICLTLKKKLPCR